MLDGLTRMEPDVLAHSFVINPSSQGAIVSTILIGVEDSERSTDAVAFGRRLARVSGADVVVACAFPYSDRPSRASSGAYRAILRKNALVTAHRMCDRLEGIAAERIRVRIVADPSPAHALHDIAHAEGAGIVVVGSTHTGRLGRVTPGSTGERLLHGSPCAVAIVPSDYRTHADDPIRRIGVAYDGSEEGRAAVAAAVALARALDAVLEVAGVVPAEAIAAPAMIGGPSYVALREDVERQVQEGLDALASELPTDVKVECVRLTGEPAELLSERTAGLDLMVTGSRGYGPLRSVLVGGVSGRLARTAHCPVIVVPRGIEAPLGALFATTTTTTTA